MLQAWKEKDPEQRIKMAHSVLAESQSKYFFILQTFFNTLNKTNNLFSFTMHFFSHT